MVYGNFDSARFDSAWERYARCGQQAHAPFLSYLWQGASFAALEAVERAIGCTFGPDLRYLLSRHNGSSEHQVLPGWELFSAERIADEWTIWRDLYVGEFKPEKYKCNPVGPIRGGEWWRLKWIPFCGDGGGNHLCIDMDPAWGGKRGQVISMWHDDPCRERIAGSLTEFIEMIARNFEQGKLIWDDDWGGVYEPVES